ncbi:glycosyltransferase [Lactiplantibacillus nangangensis]|uniref:Glycosyltransferase n=1 Tax=Lactiplantibacillus nangangensis TaxID=2559917 RepID=A0ABW1SIT0_9LACO|nr:glycosyltransferase [Lactiplantibacillus nangangensis]
MRIVVNDIVAVPDSGGVFSVLTDFYEEVLQYSKLHNEIEWIFLLSGPYVQETANIKVIIKPKLKRSKIARLLFELFSGGKVINQLHPDIYFSLQNTMTLGVKASKWDYVHQPLTFQNEIRFSPFRKEERNLWVHQAIIGHIINYTIKHTQTNVIVQTKWMKDAILQRHLALPSRVFILPPNNIHVDSSESNALPDFSSFFYPATAMKYKNHEFLFNAVRELEARGNNFEVICTLTEKNVADLNLSVPKSVKLVGMLDRKTVMTYYKKHVLVFPSLLETFGLPLLEARQSGDYILAGNTSFGNEILNGYPNREFFNLKDVSDLVQKMESCIQGKRNIVKVIDNRKRSKLSLVTLIQRGN